MINTRLFKSFALLAVASVLAACDGGSVGTTENPDLTGAGGNSGFNYSGPAARNSDVNNFKQYLWDNVQQNMRCADCHVTGGPGVPFFDTADVNFAYDQAMAPNPPYVDLVNPSNSPLVLKFNSPHFCSRPLPSMCGLELRTWIEIWQLGASGGGTSSRDITLTAPANIRDPGDSKSFPPSATTVGTNSTSLANTVHPLLVGSNPDIANDNCQNCHEEIATPLPQAPFFASGDVDSAYEAAKSKMDIDTPSNSRFVQRLDAQHNCWSNCSADATLMEQRIALFAAGIASTSVDPSLVISKALTLSEGLVASGGRRHETDQIALWEFKAGTGLTAYDTSAIDPKIHLTLLGNVDWIGGYGLEFSGGQALGNANNSDKLFDEIQSSGEYALEAWVIPANVTQEDAHIMGYSGGDMLRNFTLAQNLYNYDAFNRIDATPPQPNGEPFLSTGENDEELAQASLQHVVVNYDPINGRSVYVNGQQVMVTDPVAGPTTIANVWDDTFAFILGNEISGNRPWMGQIRLAAMHNRALSQAQILQNYDVGVGEKYFLLFFVGDHLGESTPVPSSQSGSFIMFEVAQFDNYSYLFNKPTFINLDPSWVPGTIDIEGLRIGINGKEANAGQAFANVDAVVDGASYTAGVGQQLSTVGTIIALENGPESDEFFLTFERIASSSNAFTEATPAVPADPADPSNPIESDIGMRTFDEINASIAAITGVPITNSEIVKIYTLYIQQLPTVEDIDAFLPSHQMAVAQLAMTSCSELVEGNGSITPATYFPAFNFGLTAPNAFTNATQRDAVIDPLLTAVMNVDQATPANNLTTQPSEAEVVAALGSSATQTLDTGTNVVNYESLITELLALDASNTTARTAQIVKAVCATTTGAAVMLIQ